MTTPGDEANEESKNKDGIDPFPTTPKEMFQFDAAVMGFGTSMWMNDILQSFDNIVTDVSNSDLPQEEYDILMSRVVRVATGK